MYRSPGNSDCHIHGATPARDFIEYIAGIRMSGPMGSAVCFEPAKDAPDVRRSVPTEKGSIAVRILTKNRKKIFEYRIPAGCHVARRTGAKITEVAPEKGSWVMD